MTTAAIEKNNLENEFQKLFFSVVKAFKAFPKDPVKDFREAIKDKFLDSLSKELLDASSKLDDLKNKIQNAPINKVDAFYEEMHPFIEAFNRIEEEFQKDEITAGTEKEQEFLDLIKDIFKRWNELFDQIEAMIEEEETKQNTKIAIQTLDQT